MRTITRGIPQKTAQPSHISDTAVGQALGLQELASTIQHLKDLKQQFEAEHQDAQSKREADHIERIGQLDNLITLAHEHIQTIKKGDKGDKGDTPVIDEQGIVKKVLANIRQPKDGETPVIDYGKIAKQAAKLIPKPQDGKTPTIDHEAIIERVFEKLDSGQRKLKIKHIDDFHTGLEQTIAPIRHLAAGFRGGGDTVAAGTNVTITSTNGVKTISAASASFTELAATGTINGTNTAFTFTSKPTYIVSDGVWYKENAGWTYSGSTATMTVAPTSSIYGIA